LSRVKCCTKHKYEIYWEEEIKELPVLQENANCSFEVYAALLLKPEIAKLRNIMTKRRNT
jgi:hypothetical protein